MLQKSQQTVKCCCMFRILFLCMEPKGNQLSTSHYHTTSNLYSAENIFGSVLFSGG